jgi:hypothetical protein
MIDRIKIKSLSSYKEILSKGYRDISGKIQEKKGAFMFDPYGKVDYSELREYRVASNGNVSWSKVGYNKVIAKILSLDRIEEYDKAFKSILNDIEKFSEKMSRRGSLVDDRVSYRRSIIEMPFEVKKRIIRIFLITTLFENEYVEPEATADRYLKAIRSEEVADYIINSRLHPESVGDFKKNKRIIDKLI